LHTQPMFCCPKSSPRSGTCAHWKIRPLERLPSLGSSPRVRGSNHVLGSVIGGMTTRIILVTPQCYGCINHMHHMSIIIYSSIPRSSSTLSDVILCKKCDLSGLNRLPRLVLVCTMLVFVLYALVISLSMLNSTLGTMFMLITSPK